MSNVCGHCGKEFPDGDAFAKHLPDCPRRGHTITSKTPGVGNNPNEEPITKETAIESNKEAAKKQVRKRLESES